MDTLNAQPPLRPSAPVAATPLTETIHYHHLQPVEMPRMGGKLTTKQIYKISSLRPTCPLFKVLMKLTFFCKVVYIRYPAGISAKKHCNEHAMNSNKSTQHLQLSPTPNNLPPSFANVCDARQAIYPGVPGKPRDLFGPCRVIQTLKQALTAPNKEDLGLAHDFLTKNGGWGGRLAGANK